MFLVYLSIRNYVYVKPFYSTQSRRKLYDYAENRRHIHTCTIISFGLSRV